MLLQRNYLNWLELTNSERQKQEPRWGGRLEGKLKELSQDVDFMNNLLGKRNIKK